MSQIQEIYTKLASEYDESTDKLFRKWFIRDAEYRRRAIRKLNLKKGGKILDIGCGTGRNFQFLQEKVGEKGNIVGLDLTLPMLRRAKEKMKKKRWKNVNLIQGDAAWLPFRRAFHAVAVHVLYELGSILSEGNERSIKSSCKRRQNGDS
jgi:demethylmenaquinone methyltransferase/2-methoxy-6-polyprenyl-1,4-benzoquinol methylase